MAVEIACGNCGNAFGVQPDWAGLAVQCPFCEVALQVPIEVATTQQSTPNEFNGSINAPESSPSRPEPTAAFSIDTGKTKTKTDEIPSLNIATSKDFSNSAGSTDPVKPQTKTEGTPTRKTKTDLRWKTGSATQNSPASSTNTKHSSPPVTAPSPPTPPVPPNVGTSSAIQNSPKETKADSNDQQQGSGKSPSSLGKSSSTTKSNSKRKQTPQTKPAAPNEGTVEDKKSPANLPETALEPLANPVDPNLSASQTTNNEPTPQDFARQSAETTQAEDLVQTEDKRSGQPDENSAMAVTVRPHPLAFPPTIWHSENLAQQVDVVVRAGVKQIEFQGEKVLIRDDENARNMYQIAGFILSLITLIAALAWVTFR